MREEKRREGNMVLGFASFFLQNNNFLKFQEKFLIYSIF